ncbi:MAG: hypothetical protein FWH48_04765 [Oscillospiraceae bacterium]|nr:hypothetical protein [Oscillospiraceae bacterium]
MKRKIIFALILTLLFLPSCKKNQEPLASLDADDSDNLAYEARLKEVEEMLNNIEKKIDIDKEEADPTSFHDVRTSGAVGDGKTDDTAAFLAAIELAKKDGLPVYVPYGTYLISDTLTLSSVTLFGYVSGAWTADSDKLPTLIHGDSTKPLFVVASGSVSGLHIQGGGEGEAPCFFLTTPGGRIGNMKISNPYIAIQTDTESTAYNPGRCYIENIFIIQARNKGLYIGNTYDVATLCNIEVWNPNLEITCPVAFHFAKNDDLRAVNLFAFNANTGFLIDNTSENGGFWGSLSNCSVDFTSIGIKVTATKKEDDAPHLTVTGGTYWTHHMALQIEDKATGYVTVSGCELKSNGERTVNIGGNANITVSGCTIIRMMEGHTSPAVSISGGGTANISGNTILALTNAVEIAGNGGMFNLTGNNIICGGKAITDKSRNSTVKIDNNVKEG